MQAAVITENGLEIQDVAQPDLERAKSWCG